MLDYLATVMNGCPLMWVVFGLATLLPLVAVFTYCFWLKVSYCDHEWPYPDLHRCWIML